MLANNEFIEFNYFNNNFYGTSKKEIERISKDRKVCLLELDVNGANQIFNMNYPANYLGLLPPSIEILKQRLIGRGTDSQEVIDKRVNIGVNECQEIEKSNIFNNKIVNDDLEKAYCDFKSNIFSLYPDLKF